MTFDTYIFILCLIVYLLLVSLSTIVITIIARMSVKLIDHGAEDEKIKKEYEKACKKERKRGIVDSIISVLFCVIFLGAFSFSLYVNLQGDKFYKDIPTLKVVNSASMSKKHEKNTYLTENGLDNQFQTFDLICLYELPAEADLKLYDIVLYEVDEILIIHRIVGIEEPNEKHPDERYFLLQGDAVERPDRFPVHYSQMRAIYRGQKVQFAGSFVLFMQSPAGWLCMILMLAATVATPIIDKKLANARLERYEQLCQSRQAVATPNTSRGLSPKWGAPVYVYPVYYDPAQVAYSTLPKQNKGGGKSK